MSSAPTSIDEPGVEPSVSDKLGSLHQHELAVRREAHAGLPNDFGCRRLGILGSDLAEHLEACFHRQADYVPALRIRERHAVVRDLDGIEAERDRLGKEARQRLAALGGEHVLGELAADERPHRVALVEFELLGEVRPSVESRRADRDLGEIDVARGQT